MVRQLIYPNYINNYYYNEGDDYITLKRTRGSEQVYQDCIVFKTPEEALKYFEEECGA